MSDENVTLPPTVDHVEQMLNTEAPVAVPDTQPMYKVIGDTRIPVSKVTGEVWKGRKQAGETARKPFCDAWEEAFKYYANDQMMHRVMMQGDRSGNTYYARRRNNVWTETENIVFSNIQAILPALYAKNPSSEVTATNRANADWAACVENLINTLAQRDSAPGINLKPKAKQAIITGKLTNYGFIEIGWTTKDNSSEEALNTLATLSADLAQETNTPEDIKRIEGELMALEDKIDFLQPSGPFARLRDPRMIIVDPSVSEPDFGDARWMMIGEFINTRYLNARFSTRNAETGQYQSIYQPSHILSGDASASSAVEQEVNSFKAFSTDPDPVQYGYASKEQMKANEYTFCWWVWDKTTMRVLLFNDKDWAWPVWVWDDPYRLPRFFPLRACSFHAPAQGAMAKGEVSYYLDQQDAINEINDESRRARQQLKHNVLYDMDALGREDVEAWLKGDDGTARGIKLKKDNMVLRDAILEPPVLAAKYPQLFDKQTKLQAIDRIARVGDVLRGAQFKTNTTNDAVETYNSVAMMGIDAQIDVVEDFIGAVMSDLAFLCIRFMEQQTVADLIGNEYAAHWRQLQPNEIIQRFNAKVVGGSTQKPTSQFRKREAIQLGQVLGQFAKAAPIATLEIALRLFEGAFDEIDLQASDWDRIRAESERTVSNAGDGGGGGGGGGGDIQQIAALIDRLPAPAKVALGNALARGVPIAEAIPQMLQLLQQNSVQPPQGQPQQQQPATRP